MRCENKKQQSVEDVVVESSMKALLHGAKMRSETEGGRPPLLRSPVNRVRNGRYLSVYIGSISMAGSSTIHNPFLNIYPVDPRLHPVEAAQATPHALIQDKHHLWWGNTWHMQSSLEHLSEGSFIVFELLRHNFQLDEPQVLCWTFIRVEFLKLTMGPQALEMYTVPVNPLSLELCRFPGDAFLSFDIVLS